MTEQRVALRLDKWLWQARFFKTRARSVKQITAGHVRLNGQKVAKPATPLRVGDLLEFVQENEVRNIRVVGLGSRRGPATEAQTLYDDLTPKTESPEITADGPNNDHKGRPTKKDRRLIDKMRRNGP